MVVRELAVDDVERAAVTEDGRAALIVSLALSGVALILIGGGTSLFTGRSLPVSALRQLLIGYAAAAVTYGVGALVGVSLGG